MALTTRSNGQRIDASWFNDIKTEIEAGVIPYVTKTSDYTATNSDFVILCDATGGNITITLPTINGNEGERFIIKKIDSSGNSVTIDGNGAETIDGGATLSTTKQYSAFYVINGGTEWNAIGLYQKFTSELVDLNSSQSLTNKTINADNNTISNLAHGAEVDNPSSGVHGVSGSVVGTTDSQTLSSKTLTSPIINTSVSGTAVKDEDDMSSNSATAICTQQSIKAYSDSGTQTLTNKTMSGSNNTFSNIPATAITQIALKGSVSATAQSTPTGVVVPVEFHFIQHDTNSGWNAGSSYNSGTGVWGTANDTRPYYDVPSSGYYHVFSKIKMTDSSGWTAGERLILYLYVNNSLVEELGYYEVSATNTQLTTVNGGFVDYFNANDKIDIRVDQNSGVNITINDSYISIFMV